MANIRIMAAAAAIIAALAFMLAPASARPCEERDSTCAEPNPGAPLRLNQFLKHNRSATTLPAEQKTSVAAKPAPVVQAARPNDTTGKSTADVAAASDPDAGPVRTIEPDGVAVTSADDLNEIDALADRVRVVAAEEFNEIDLAANTPPIAPAQKSKAPASMASGDEPGADTAWIGKLLAAFAGTIAVAAAARLLIA